MKQIKPVKRKTYKVGRITPAGQSAIKNLKKFANSKYAKYYEGH